VNATRSPFGEYLAAKHARDLPFGTLGGKMFVDKQLDQIVHAVDDESTAGLLLLGCRIFALCAGGEYLERGYASLVQGNATVRPDRVFAQTRSGAT